MDHDWQRTVEGMKRSARPMVAGLSTEELTEFIYDGSSLAELLHRPWYDRAPWSYLLGAIAALPFAFALNGATHWMGWS